jgi:hypothetical protein
MRPYAACMYVMASAWRAYMRTHDLWTLQAFEVWSGILAASDRG